MSQSIFCGRGTKVSHGDFMNLINVCFGFTSPESDFRGLLPKCYREEYRPQDSNYVVIDEEGNLAAAVGAYDHEIEVCGRRIPCRGIGNVGVHPDHRKKGYMKLAMDQSLSDMIADGIALSTLGGRRQRYQYFGYDKAGPIYHFYISDQNCHHLFGDTPSSFTVREITDPTDPVIREIRALNAASPFCPIRDESTYLDIAVSWKAALLTLWDGDRFVGYCIKERGPVTEVQTVRDVDFMEVIHALFDHFGGAYTVHIPPHQHAYASALAPVAEGIAMNCAMHFNVLNYRSVIEAFLALKLTYTTLPEGSLSLLIHGYARDERLRVVVRSGTPSVEVLTDTAPVDFELPHLDAMEFLFSPICAFRDTACDLARIWFPLPICMYRADEV